MTRSAQLIRLSASVIIAFAACKFVVLYHDASKARYPFDHPDADDYRRESGEFVLGIPTPAIVFVDEHRAHAYAVPFAGLLLGVLITWRWPRFYALSELIVSALWVAALAYAGFAVLIWQIQNCPIFRGMRWHY